MVNFFNSWAQNIIIVVVICTIIEMIMPENKNKKYIKTVAGIYVIFTIVSPIISKFNNSNKEKIDLEKYLKISTSNLVETSVVIDNDKYIEELYKEKLCKDIEAKRNALGYKVVSIYVEVETKSEKDNGRINKLNLKILSKKEADKEKEENKDKQEKEIIKIDPVIIGKDNNIKEIELENEEKEIIKKYLQETYYLEKDKIFIE